MSEPTPEPGNQRENPAEQGRPEPAPVRPPELSLNPELAGVPSGRHVQESRERTLPPERPEQEGAPNEPGIAPPESETGPGEEAVEQLINDNEILRSVFNDPEATPEEKEQAKELLRGMLDNTTPTEDIVKVASDLHIPREQLSSILHARGVDEGKIAEVQQQMNLPSQDEVMPEGPLENYESMQKNFDTLQQRVANGEEIPEEELDRFREEIEEQAQRTVESSEAIDGKERKEPSGEEIPPRKVRKILIGVLMAIIVAYIGGLKAAGGALASSGKGQ